MFPAVAVGVAGGVAGYCGWFAGWEHCCGGVVACSVGVGIGVEWEEV